MNKKKIIIVDDSESVRMFVFETLDNAGYEVIVAENGQDGMNKILQTKDAVLMITDYNMPKMDGIVMLRNVKEKLGKLPFPVFMLTTETSERLKAMGKELGVIGWINKPCNPVKLLAAIVKVLAKK